MYEELYNKGVDIVFLKEPHCNTAKYREALQKQIDITVSTGDTATDEFMNTIISALNKLQMDLAKRTLNLLSSRHRRKWMICTNGQPRE